MRLSHLAAGAMMVVASLGITPSQAEGECTIASGGTAAPHLVDPANDWEGIVAGNGSATVPYGDVLRESTDLLGVWLERSETGGVSAHIRTQALSGLEANAVYYVLWDYPGATPAKSRRFVSGQPRLYDAGLYRYGYLDQTTTAVGTFVSEGTTTGRSVAGSPGEVVIDIPLGAMGDPPEGTTLSNFAAEARVRLGFPGHAAAPSTQGVVGVADNTANAEGCFEIAL